MTSSAQAAAAFLDHLVGHWELTGQMGQTPLRQIVEARWRLGGLFVELYFKSLLPTPDGRPPYEAVYFVGYSDASDQYTLHLLDTFGVSGDCHVGRARRAGEALPFVFQYASGPFTNRFQWEADGPAWSFEQTYLQAGQTRVFATKRMVRR